MPDDEISLREVPEHFFDAEQWNEYLSLYELMKLHSFLPPQSVIASLRWRATKWTEIQFTSFLTRACALAAQHSRNGALHFICMDWRHIGELLTAGRRTYSELKNVCVWVRHNAGTGSFYRNQHELVFVFKHGPGAQCNNVELGRFGRHWSNVWTYVGANSFGRGAEEGILSAIHPTVKPVTMVADAVLNCSARGDIVLDPFLGTGTTLIAAERTGRRCRGIEINPIYIDVIICCWQRITGERAIHAVTGKSFTETEAQRGMDDGSR